MHVGSFVGSTEALCVCVPQRQTQKLNNKSLLLLNGLLQPDQLLPKNNTFNKNDYFVVLSHKFSFPVCCSAANGSVVDMQLVLLQKLCFVTWNITRMQFCSKVSSQTRTHTHTPQRHTAGCRLSHTGSSNQCPQDSDRLFLTSRKGRVTFLVSSILQSPCCILHKIATEVGSLIPRARAMLIEPSTFFRQHFALG